jgi:flagellar motor switch protein FliM
MALDTPNYEEFRKRLLTPIHIALVKAEPVGAINIVALPPTLGLMIADRLMGGPGIAEGPERDMSDIEAALLDQAIQIIMSDYFKWLPTSGTLKPVVIAHESHPSFLKKGGPDHRMMVLSLEAVIGEAKHTVEIALPFDLVGGLVDQFRAPETVGATSGIGAPKDFWTEQLQELPMSIQASWQSLNLRAGQIGRLRVGDVVPLDPEFVSRVQLRLGPKTLLFGRLGSMDGQRAIQLTSIPSTRSSL